MPMPSRSGLPAGTTVDPNSYIGTNLKAVYARIIAAAEKCGRDPASIRLIAVSKTFAADRIGAAHAAGQRAFGESYAQEAIEKMPQLPGDIEWHFIGPLQSNKTRGVATHFTWVHSVDRLKIAQRLSEQRPEDMLPLQICLQVNVSGESSKSGADPEQVAALARAMAALPRLRLRGLMTIPEPTDDQILQRQRFASLRNLRDNLAAGGLDLDTLSMGMSDDLEAAVLEGATMVRVGRAIFGQRP